MPEKAGKSRKKKFFSNKVFLLLLKKLKFVKYVDLRKIIVNSV